MLTCFYIIWYLVSRSMMLNSMIINILDTKDTEIAWSIPEIALGLVIICSPVVGDAFWIQWYLWIRPRPR